MSDVWPCVIDGVVEPTGRVSVGAHAEVLTHGEGLFETLPVIDGRPRFLDAHLSRLSSAAAALGFAVSPSAETVLHEIGLIVRATGERDFALRLTLFRDGTSVRRLLAPSRMPVDRDAPVKLGLARPPFSDPRAIGRLKTLNYLVNRMAHADGVRRGFDEVLFLDHRGTVLEGSRSTIFLIEGKKLVTPPLTLPILPGVTRDVILEEAVAMGLEVVEEPFGLARLLAADMVFISASVRGLRPAMTLDGRPLGIAGHVLCDTLAARYRARLAEG